ncbi:DUF1579 domain-containing protein [Pseudohongiella sp. O18]|uniref:DUF1579 domain-containing protein n=1 Tax=Pseudohongiella sp. O18 TaxID=2904248 RepID=UPI001F1AC954|nr:DUF1579 domain-containing protein [Pseudohongiella sp. O18]
MNWKKGRGKLGIFDPLIGSWLAESSSDMGPVVVHRSFSKLLGGKYIELRVEWKFVKSSYEELALFGIDRDKSFRFWSFTSDGKHSEGVLTDAKDVHGDSLAFEAQMPGGVARQVYWPDPDEGFNWVVESKTKKGWNRFVEHHYKQIAGS